MNTTRKSKEGIKNNPQVYTTQEGKKINSNPQVYTTQEGKKKLIVTLRYTLPKRVKKN